MQNPGPERKRDRAGIRPAAVALALLEPEIAPNVGAIIRLGACLGLPVHVIEPCGFPFSPRAWRRQAMDYAGLAELHRHDSWQAFLGGRPPGRLVALAPEGGAGSGAGGGAGLWDFRFAPGDLLMLGRESTGLGAAALAAAEARVAIPMQPGARSLNLAMAAAIAGAEAVRQLRFAAPARR